MHKPALLNEVLEIFNPQPGEVYVDATVNGGGHARAIAERVGEKGLVLGIDWDCDLIEELRVKNLELRNKNIKLVCDNYANLGDIIREHNLDAPCGILFDLGFSSHHLEESGRGFSFLKREPLDMRYDVKFNGLTAEKIINTWECAAIEDILRLYGEERFASQIAQGIERARRQHRIQSTAEFVEIISRSVPPGYRYGRIHFATRTFQALRIAVNHELENLENVLPVARDAIRTGGKIVVISFHSLEDRIVKEFFKKESKSGTLKILTKKPIKASWIEIMENPRARSAKLRAAIKAY
ncbi:MAG: 16S rRNA (cytosine(1402)-N(4))-methyltransferase RsmH [Candidatus Sungbacteria bacterium]|nr:16S rRNA (cytosine(1402)-N(4))-methyltransferase RsmH [Candidatus Sungbacteria bacterium]